MRILLVRAAEGRSLETNITGLFPPLGLAYLASALRDARHTVAFLDEQLVPPRSFRETLVKFSPDAVLLSSTTPQWNAVAALSRRIKDISADIVVGVGGPHLTLYPRETLSLDTVDFGVYGEGERTIVEVLDRLGSGKTLEGVEGCVCRLNGAVTVNPPRAPLADLDAVPFPAIELLPYKKYFAFSVRHPFFPMVTSRGCPYRCRFCFQGHLGPYRARSARNVVEEMELLVNKYGIREIIIFDETFAAEEERALEICGLILEKKIACGWDIRTRVNLMNKRILGQLRKAGCKRLHFGIESGDERILAAMNKGFGLREIREKVGLAKRLGFETRGYFMLAFPGEDRLTMSRTMEFARSLPLDWASFTLTCGLSGTDIYDEALRSGRFPLDVWKEYASGAPLRFKPFFIPEGMSEDELLRLKREAYMKFYLRPRILGRIGGKLCSPGFLGNLFPFLRLLPRTYHSLARI